MGKKVYLKFPKGPRLKKNRGALRIQRMFEKPGFKCNFCPEDNHTSYCTMRWVYWHIRKEHKKWN